MEAQIIVNNFGIKYEGKEHAMHLLTCLKIYYDKVTTDWKGELYAGINLEWNYKKRWVKARIKRCVATLICINIEPQNISKVRP